MNNKNLSVLNTFFYYFHLHHFIKRYIAEDLPFKIAFIGHVRCKNKSDNLEVRMNGVF